MSALPAFAALLRDSVVQVCATERTTDLVSLKDVNANRENDGRSENHPTHCDPFDLFAVSIARAEVSADNDGQDTKYQDRSGNHQSQSPEILERNL